MKKSSIAHAIILGFIFSATSCTHDKLDNCVAGTSGNLTLNVFLQHGEHQVVNIKKYCDTVFIKYNVNESPGISPADYDTFFVGYYPGDSVCIPNLSCGNYFLFDVGFESFHSKRITGGTPFNTKENDGTFNVTIQGTE